MTDIRISVVNTSATGGTFLTPLWFGFHDGEFDLYDRNAPTSAGLESLAEDGDAALLGAELTAVDTDARGGVVRGAGGVIAPGETTSTIVTVDGRSNGFFDFASMIIPSNDAFIGSGTSIKLFDDDGNFLGATEVVLSGSDVLDAGTEVNTEMDAAFINQLGANTGIDENGVVTQHPGFNGSLGHPGGDQIILGGTNALGQTIDPIAADFTQPGATIATIHVNTVNVVDLTGNSNFRATSHDDIVTGSDGRNIIRGGDGWDELHGEGGNDHIFGGDGNDLIAGGDGDDVLFGNDGNDRIYGGDGDDRIRDGAGDDLVIGGTGNDIVLLGGGADVIVFGVGDGDDIVRGFGDDDTLLLSFDGIGTVEEALANATEVSVGVRFDFGDDSLIVAGVSLEDFGADNLLFA